MAKRLEHRTGAGPAPGSALHLGAELRQAPLILLVTRGRCSELGEGDDLLPGDTSQKTNVWFFFFYLKGKVSSLCNQLPVERCESCVRVPNLATVPPVFCEASGGVNDGATARPGVALAPTPALWSGKAPPGCPADALERWGLQKAELSSLGSFCQAHQFSVASVGKRQAVPELRDGEVVSLAWQRGAEQLHSHLMELPVFSLFRSPSRSIWSRRGASC